jgi:hypothetical protein
VGCRERRRRFGGNGDGGLQVTATAVWRERRRLYGLTEEEIVIVEGL